MGSDDHAQAAASTFLLAASCQLHDLDVGSYLADVVRAQGHVYAHRPRTTGGTPQRRVNGDHQGTTRADRHVGYPVADSSAIWLWIARTLSQTPSQP